MIELTLILAAAVVALGVARATRLPHVPLLVLAGIGLTAVNWLFGDELISAAFVQDVLIFGVTFLVFLAGTELNPRRIGRQLPTAIKVGLAQFFLLGGVGVAVTRLGGFDWVAAAYLGLAVTASSTLVVVNLLRQRQQFFEPFGRLVLGVLLLQDVLVVVLLSGLTHLEEGVPGVTRGLVAVGVLFVAAWVGLRWAWPWVLLRLKGDEEAQLLTVLGIVFLFVGGAYWLDLPLIAGAFLAGVSLSGFPLSGLIRGQMSSLSDFFLALFFVALGATLTLPGLNALVLAGLLILVVVLLTPPLVTWIAERAGLSARVSIESGLLLAQCSEFSLVVALIGFDRGYLEQPIVTVVALVTVTTMMLTPFVATDRLTWALMRWHPASGRHPDRKRDSGRTRYQDHVLLLGCGDNGLLLLEHLLARGERVVVVDDDPAVVQHLRDRVGVDAIRGDGADYFVLRRAGARSAKAIVSTMRRLSDHERLLRFARDVPALVRVFTPEGGERVRELGGTPIIYGDAAAEAFLAWYQRFTSDTGTSS